MDNKEGQYPFWLRVICILILCLVFCPCISAFASKLVKRDTDNDGQIDQIAHLTPARVLVLLEMDSDKDGKMDRYQYYRKGKIDRLEADVDGDEIIDTRDLFKNGKRIRHLQYFPDGKKIKKIINFDDSQLPQTMHQDSTADGFFDTVYHFKNGNLSHSTRDSDADAQPNIWTTYSNNLPTIQKCDRNGNGKIESLIYFDEGGLSKKSLHDLDEDNFYEEIRFYKEGGIEKQQKDIDKNSRFEIETLYVDDAPTEQKKDTNNDSAWDVVTHFKNGQQWKQKKDSDYDSRYDWFCQFDAHGRIEKLEQDTNGNSIIDVVRLYTAGKLRKILNDDDEDSFYETETIMEKGHPTLQIQDTNKDRKMDVTIKFDKDGVKAKTSIDSNFNGQEDVWEYYTKGELIRLEQDPRESGQVSLRSFYQHGNKVRIERDQDGDGRFEITEKLDDDKWSTVIEWDKDGDTNPEQRICSLDGIVRLKESDADSDGRMDMCEEYSPDGTIIRLREDVDNSGRLNLAWKYNEDGEPVAAEKDSDGDDRTDIWYLYEKGKIVNVREDLNKDGNADLWEYYDTSETLVKITKDLNFDGKPDTIEEL